VFFSIVWIILLTGVQLAAAAAADHKNALLFEL
jgi:hypothetical protein